MNLHINRPYLKSGASSLNFQPVFDEGYIVCAWVGTQMIRIVTIEDANAAYLQQDRTNVRPTFVGKSKDIEGALKDALVGFHKGLHHDKMYARRLLRNGSSKTTGQLDHWLFHHKATMQLVQDIDGTILCRLSGLKNPQTDSYQQVSAEGRGRHLQAAVQDAFQYLTENKSRIVIS
jgi:hypothetical protein